MKIELLNAGHPLTKGNREFDAISKVAVIGKQRGEDQKEINEDDNFNLGFNYTRGQYTPDKSRDRRGSQNYRPTWKREGCYICGKGHSWRYCPEKRCAVCGEKGHIMRDSKRNRTYSKKIK